MKFRISLLLVFLTIFIIESAAQNSYVPKILNMQQREEVIDAWLVERAETVLPEIMKRSDIDMWVVISSEYNEDPVMKTLLPATWLSARRLTMLIAYDPGQGQSLEYLTISRYDVGKVFKAAWNKETQPDQWKALAEIITSRDPKKIGVNKSNIFGLADGLSATHYEQLMGALPEKYKSRVVSAENIVIRWLETRTESEMVVYQNIVRIAHQIIAEGLSEKVIQRLLRYMLYKS